MRLTKADKTISNNQELGYISQKEEPNQQYEVTRRRIENNIREFWAYVNSELVNIQTQVKSLAPDLVGTISNTIKLGIQHKRSLIHDVQLLSDVDGFATWREKEINALSDKVQNRFKYLQNPKDCKKARKLVCSLNKVIIS